MDDNRLLVELPLPPDASSVQTLAPTIATLVAAHPQPPGLLSITIGPGSFTSLRVGLTTAKMLAYAWKIPIAAVCSLKTIAAQALLTGESNHGGSEQVSFQQGTSLRSSVQAEFAEFNVIAAMNAYRKQVFVASWAWQHGRLIPQAEAQVLDATMWCASPLESMRTVNGVTINTSHPTVITGPGLSLYQPQIGHIEDITLSIAPQSVWDITASTVGKLGWEQFLNGNTTTAENLFPNYVRGSAAEEKVHNN